MKLEMAVKYKNPKLTQNHFNFSWTLVSHLTDILSKYIKSNASPLR